MRTTVFRAVPLVLLLLTACGAIAASVANRIPQHVCHFDEIHNKKEVPPATKPPPPPSQPSQTPQTSGAGSSQQQQPETKKRTKTKTLTLTATASQSGTDTETDTVSDTASASETMTGTHSESHSESNTHSESHSESRSESGTHSMSRSESLSESLTLLTKKANSILADLSAASWTAYLAAAPGPQQVQWKPLRIAFSAQDLEDSKKHCGNANVNRSDVFGASIVCKQEDVLTDVKRQSLYRIVRSAIAMHTSRLSVTPAGDNLKVPALQDAFCKLFTVPAEHTSKGVANTDMVLYVASFPSSKANMFAAGAPCALQNENTGRPIVGALTYTTKHITATVYSVRVAMHEIAHALGFTYPMMKTAFGMAIVEKNNIRHKTKVTEVQSAKVLEKAKAHYGCDNATGMELEDETGVLSVASRSHWERRNALEELMAGIVTTGAYTSLTLAAFDDMKVYQADHSKAETMEWGNRAGCDLLTKRCFGDGKEFPPMFCKEEGPTTKQLHCAPGRRAFGRCSKIATESNLHDQYKYIDGTKAGETTLLTDRCPIYEEHSDTSCTTGKGVAGIGLVDPQSWCLRKKTEVTPGKATMAAAAPPVMATAVQVEGICGKVSATGQSDVSVTFTANGASTKCATEGSKLVVTAPGAATKYACPSFQEVRGADAFSSTHPGTSSTSDKGKVDATPKQRGLPSPGAQGNKKDGASLLGARAPLLLLAVAALLLCG